MSKKLVKNVSIDGTLYGPDGKEPTAEILERITNPYAFVETEVTTIRTGVGPSEVDEARGLGGDAGTSGEPDVNAGINASGAATGDAGSGAPDTGGGAPAVNVEDLKGKDLEEALEKAGLAKSGSVAEKRARLQEHLAGTSS